MPISVPSDSAVSRNSTNGEVIAQYAFDDRPSLEASLGRSFAGFSQWRSAPVAQLAGVLRAHFEPMARMITAEMGKRIVQARADIESAPRCAIGMYTTVRAFYGE